MATEEAKQFGIAEKDRRLHIRVTNGKANMGPLGKAEWLKIEVENLPNGDEVACASSWKPPDPFQGITNADMGLAQNLAATGAFRDDSRSPEWFGYALAKQLNIPVSHGTDNDPKHIVRLQSIIKTWKKNKVLSVESRKDNKRRTRNFIVPGSSRPPQVDAAYTDDDITLQ
jgi:hypothetical protein